PSGAVNDVSFDGMRGECLGLVGESGCGKTTLSKMLMRGISADPNEGGGRVVFDDWGRKTDVMMIEGADLNRFRTKLQFIFQDPFGSLNPRMTVYDILVEPLLIHAIGNDAYRREMVGELMELVGLDRRQLSRYPHSFSGGQRQRIGIARALARPEGADGRQGLRSFAVAAALHRLRQEHAALDRGRARPLCPRRPCRRLGQGGSVMRGSHRRSASC